MTDNKPTDNEIVKALETLLELVLCEGCPQRAKTINLALDLINRQKAEIERLADIDKRLGENVDLKADYIHELETKLKIAKAEAIKEFAERLKEKCKVITICNYGFIRNEINKVVKEMVGDVG